MRADAGVLSVVRCKGGRDRSGFHNFRLGRGIHTRRLGLDEQAVQRATLARTTEGRTDVVFTRLADGARPISLAADDTCL